MLMPLIAGCTWSDYEDPALQELDLSLKGLAEMFAQLPIGSEQMQEVLTAVDCSSGNGYDEEYMMCDMLTNPGAGVRADESQTKAAGTYSRPMKTLIQEYLSSRTTTKSLFGSNNYKPAVERQMDAIAATSAQIYWPYSEDWDGETAPIITFDPGGDASVNVGYQLELNDAGERVVTEVVVTEEIARQRPVWVINNNEDSGYDSLEMLRRADPDWGKGGDIVVVTKSGATKASSDGITSLILKDFTMNRNYDSWFGGASEFFVKVGGIESFTATTEDEMRLYSPSVTDFMIVVKRKQLGEAIPFNALLISDWTEQLDNLAFMVLEDDGGTQEKWDFELTVKIQSKSYGVDVSIPMNIKDDIVWRGGLSRAYVEKYSGIKSRFGDIDLTLELI